MKLFPKGRWAEKPFWLWVYAMMAAVVVAANILGERGDL